VQDAVALAAFTEEQELHEMESAVRAALRRLADEARAVEMLVAADR